jgi:thiol-disulfide isomerase/thioredoxin
MLALSLALSWGFIARAADPSAAEAPAAEAPAFDPFTVPQTTELKPLLEFVDQVGKWKPQVAPEMRQNEAAMANAKEQFVKSRLTMIAAIDKALKLNPTDDRNGLLHAKLDALRMVSMLASEEKTEKQAEADYEALTASLLKDTDPELARYAAKTMLMIRMNRYIEGRSTEPLDALLKDIHAALDNDETRADGMAVASNATYILEMKGQYDAARSLYQSIIRNAEKLENPQMQKQVLSRAEGGLQRLALIGQTPEVKGVQLDGKPFELSSLKGKVVLIDFWATWCGPCRAELPNVIKNYEKYSKSGFEVVGISIDDDRAALDEFIKEQPLPWITLFNPDEATRGFEDPTARKFHVNGIPATYLVDPSGKLVHINVRGDRLGELLKGYFPDVK